MSTIIINDQAVDLTLLIKHVRELAEERPNHVAPCEYFTFSEAEGTQPGCIVGHAFVRMGFDETLVGSRNATSFDSIPRQYLDEEREEMLRAFREIEWISKVQRSQDAEERWERAIMIADAKVGKYEHHQEMG